MKLYEDDTSEHLVPFEPVRSRVVIEVGAMVRRDKQVYRIVQILDLQTVIATEVETGRSAALQILDLRAVDAEKLDGLYVNHDISSISSDAWAIAQKRYSAILPLLGNTVLSKETVATRAKATGISPATLYRWLDRYNRWNEVLALVPRKRGWREGSTRLSVEGEKLIQEVLDDYYLTEQRYTVQSTISEVERRARALDIQSPGASAIRARIRQIPEVVKLRRRGYAEQANNRHTPSVGQFPDEGYPLAVVQIDHTPVNLIVVDERHRKPIGRPWLTLAIDVYSCMIAGYYLAFESPSETSVAMCIAHSILPKEAWLVAHNIRGEWPVWGFPRTIHTDNGADFRAQNIVDSCKNYGIDSVFRPSKVPKYGGRIERVLGTFMRMVHELPGTTFSNPKEREGYDSDAKAVLTMAEFEVWLVRSILKYHQTYHKKLHMSPARKWQLAFFGNREVDPLISVPARPTDPLAVQLDFLPSVRRTVQTYGVQWDLFYYSEALRHWINQKDPATGKALKLLFRRDPRDVSVIWFYDPVLKQYFRVPASYQAFPAVTLWEYHAAKDKAVSEGRENVDDALIAEYAVENRKLVEEASANSKKARKDAQKSRTHSKKGTPAQPSKPVAKLVLDPMQEDSDLLMLSEVESTGEVE
ncbi:Mu transposase C-terminal domain-containing protein [Pseudomonas protegens]|uniref:Mu transposase C-terminal domain-containing protein n=1 Tax=Pseudomonas protegens TaxID=380021 RepID=UPI00069EA885|nr:Mu transposase C-terminal domain-containing protein [Pseudomonas protegens]